MDRLAIIGPIDSVAYIAGVCEQQNVFEPVPLPYSRIEECRELILNNRHRIDFWLFSGPVPYSYCVEQEWVTAKNAAYPPLNGRGLTNVLFRVFRERTPIAGISFDTFLQNEIDETMNELHLTDIPITTYGYVGYLDASQILAHHRTIWDAGKADIIVTCIHSVYEELRAQGLPVYRVSPPISVLRQTLQIIEQRLKSERYQLSSVVIMAIEVTYPVESEQGFSNESEKLRLQLYYDLLDLAEKANGALYPSTPNLFLLYTTCGELANLNQKLSLYEFLQNIKVMLSVEAKIGIGYGLNVHLARKNGQAALEHAKQSPVSGIFEVSEDGSLHGPLEPKKHGNDHWESMIKESSLSPMLLARMEAFTKQYGVREVTPQELARFLKMTERNARRILQEMEHSGLASHVRIEQPNGRGRPRKVYKLFH
ncbi:hypothetical protein EDM52_04410 [Brevibacillus invocatus]|uniref:Transcriptional regulator n=1 Tax=Brevibacillus invocatus TaxID=173959 RepID=A0A3M8CKC9_9BACL|nr:hypothetical protein [Brevibacillus invocatus]RNB76160.1 hypothetical protein EDM52_04410 [Brevibacillus invocatus]